MKKVNFLSFGESSKLLFRGYVDIFIRCLLLAILLTVLGCKTTGGGISGPNISQTKKIQQDKKVEGGGLISVFLNLKEPKGMEVSFEISSLEINAKDDRYPLLSEVLQINSKNIGAGQIFVARNGVPANNYDSLRLTLRNVNIKDRAQKENVLQKVFEEEIELPAILLTQADDSHSLFITWDVSASFDQNGSFVPVMNTSLQAIPFIQDLIYVACPEINTIYVIRTDRNWVISSLGVPGKPTYLAMNGDLDRQRLFVLTPEKLAIQVVDLVTNKIIDNIYLPLSNQPNFMTVSADNRYAYILDEYGRNLLLVDLLTGSVVNNIVLTFQPHYALYLEEQNKLAISSLDTNTVYLLDPENYINSEMFASVSSPEGLLTLDNVLFIAESGANSVAAYDLSSKQQVAKVNVGFSPRRLLARNNQIYVTNFASNSISYMLPGQLNVSGETFLRGKPLELATSESQLWIYAGDEVKGGLNVIDSTSNRLSSFIDLRALPVGLAVID